MALAGDPTTSAGGDAVQKRAEHAEELDFTHTRRSPRVAAYIQVFLFFEKKKKDRKKTHITT